MPILLMLSKLLHKIVECEFSMLSYLREAAGFFKWQDTSLLNLVAFAISVKSKIPKHLKAFYV